MSNLKNSLIEVRKAYRFLFDFQSRVLDLISFISTKIGLNYDGGFIKFSARTPGNGSGNFQLWAWDWLNFYFYEFHFKKQAIDEDTVNFSIFLICDSGYFDAKKTQNIAQTAINSFNSPESSVTKLIFVIGKNTWGLFGEDNWKNTEFTTEPEGIKRDDNGIMLFKAYNLENFGTEEDTFMVLKDFQIICEQNGIPFTVLTRDFD